MKRIRNHLLLFLCDCVDLIQSIVRVVTLSFYRPWWELRLFIWRLKFSEYYQEPEEAYPSACTEVSELCGDMHAWNTEDKE